MPPGLFRQQALDRLSSPDQLDQTMRVADPLRWVALAAVAVLVIGALVWGFVGRIDSRTQATAVLIPRGGTYKIVTTQAGTVYDVLVQRGDRLAAGEAVAVVETADGRRQPVVAPFSGEVVELLATYGDFVQVGETMLNFDSDEEELGLLLYVSPAVSGQLQPGMAVQTALTTASRQRYGFLLGEVESVAPYPSTRDGMAALLNNDTLTDQLYRSAGGTPVEVWVRPLRADTPSGFAWSNSAGPERLRAGTIGTADIILAQRHPIELLLP